MNAGVKTRALAHDLVHGVIARGRALDDAFDTAMSAGTFEPRDRAFVRRLATGTLRHFGQSETAIARLLERKPLRPRDTALRCLFAMAASEILYLETPPHAAINGAVTLARSRKDLAHQAGLINAVLRRLAREGAHDLPAILNVPAWLRARWEKVYGAHVTRAIADAQMREPALDIAVKADPEHWAAALGAQILPTGTLRAPLGGRIEALPGFEDGAWWVQDAAATLPPALLAPEPGERILDLCAAPGGKTAYFAAQGARVTAVDRDGGRLARLNENLARLKLQANVIEADLLNWAMPDLYDKVLLDAPCSATGTIRRHPDVPYLKDERDIAALAGLQGKLLDAAARALKPGGIMVYAVCSLEAEEGEDQAAAFLARHPGFARLPVRPNETPGIGDFVTADGDLRTRPDLWAAHGGLDGFFAARFIRRS